MHFTTWSSPPPPLPSPPQRLKLVEMWPGLEPSALSVAPNNAIVKHALWWGNKMPRIVGYILWMWKLGPRRLSTSQRHTISGRAESQTHRLQSHPLSHNADSLCTCLPFTASSFPSPFLSCPSFFPSYSCCFFFFNSLFSPIAFKIPAYRSKYNFSLPATSSPTY